MKKYIKSLLITLLVVTTIGGYYSYAALYTRASQPQFSIETVAGDETWRENMKLEAYYSSDRVQSLVTITKDGSDYRSPVSFWEQLRPAPGSLTEYLQTHYRSFMRGIYSFHEVYENDQYLVVAEMDYDYYRDFQAISLSFLDKQSGAFVKSITHQVNNTQRLILEDVQMRNDEILVFTRGWKHDQDSSTLDIDIYRFHVDTAQFLNKETILSIEEDSQSSLNKLHESEGWKPVDYIVYRQKTDSLPSEPEAEQMQNAEVTEIPTVDELYAYHVTTGTLEKLQLPETLQNTIVDDFDGQRLYYTGSDHDSVKVTVYDIAAGTVTNELQLPYEAASPDALPRVTARAGYLFLLDDRTSPERNPMFTIADAVTGEVVYRGQIAVDPAFEQHGDDYILDISKIHVTF